ncbi:hypothetical protein FQR65_LT19893 [Abscondita terminalis]|nr:hypothetical protein FQR65_LT19893 [Abscondita terminalis]
MNSGILLVNKPSGITSNDLIQKIKRKINVNKIGHAGTLDPLATGLMVVLINEATKISNFLLTQDKGYNVTIQLFKKTNTADITGEVIEQMESKKLEKKDILQITSKYNGYIYDQYPPAYSAVKINGQKLYEYARKNKIEEVEIKPRTVTIKECSLIKYDNKNNTLSFKILCSKGTYIRSLIEDICNDLGIIGTVLELHRYQSGAFFDTDSSVIEDLKEENIISLYNALMKNKQSLIEYHNEKDIKNGKPINLINQHEDTVFIINDDSINHVTIVGAGYIGVELVDAFITKGKKVTLVDLADRIMPLYYDKEFTDLMEVKMKEKGVDLALGQQVSEFKGKDGKIQSVVTTKGEIKTDYVVFSVGVVPQSGPLKGVVDLSDRGAIMTNEFCQTSNKDIYAIGDCSTVFNKALNKHIPIQLATTAVRTGVIAANNVVKGNVLASPGFTGANGIEVFNFKMASCGTSEEAAKRMGMDVESVVLSDNDRPEFINQNLFAEINVPKAEEDKVTIIRRNTGGGTVFQDMGNICYSLILNSDDPKKVGYEEVLKPIIDFLNQKGVKAYFSGRNDIEVDGAKISGNAKLEYKNKILQHGTLLYNVDLSKLGNYLNVNQLKIKHKKVTSIRARVTNIIDYLENKISTQDFMQELINYYQKNNELKLIEFSNEDETKIQKLMNEKFMKKEWTYSKNSDFELMNEEYLESKGLIQVRMNVHEKIIKDIKFYGDFLGYHGTELLESKLIDVEYNREKVQKILETTNIKEIFGENFGGKLMKYFGKFDPFKDQKVEVMDKDGKIINPQLMPKITEKEIIEAYTLMNLSRRQDDYQNKMQRQGRLLSFLSSTGQEACEVAYTQVLNKKTDFFVSGYRNNAA